MVTCPRCGRRSARGDRRTYWTRNVRLVRIEAGAKLLAFSLLAVVGLAILAFPPHGQMGTGGGWAMALPVAAAVLLNEALSTITHHPRLGRPVILWPASAAALVGTIAILAGHGLGPEVGLLLAGATLFVAIGAALLARRFEDLKASLLSGHPLPPWLRASVRTPDPEA